MIECLRDDDGNITAVCEWLLFNEQGQLVDNGKILFVAELEINKSYRGIGTIRLFIRRIHEKAPFAEKVFFFRDPKYPNRKHRLYPVNRIARLGA